MNNKHQVHHLQITHWSCQRIVSKCEIKTLIGKVGTFNIEGPSVSTVKIRECFVDSSITHILCRGDAMMCETFL